MKLIITKIAESISYTGSTINFHFEIEDSSGGKYNEIFSYGIDGMLFKNVYGYAGNGNIPTDINIIKYYLYCEFSAYTGKLWASDSKLHKYFIKSMSKRVHKYVYENLDRIKKEEYDSFVKQILIMTDELSDDQVNNLVESIKKNRLMRVLK